MSEPLIREGVRVHRLARGVLGLAVVATLVGPLPYVEAAQAAVTPQGRFMQIVAHEDDDLFFMNPDVDNTIAAGVPNVTVFTTAGQITGNGSTPEAKARNRQKGAQNAYASMAGLADGDDSTQKEWDGAAWSVGGKTVERYTLRARPTIQLVFLNLRDAELYNLYTGTPQSTVVADAPDDNEPPLVPASQQYSRGDVVAVLSAVMSAFQPTVLRAQDAEPDRRAGYSPDHLDHVAAARFAAEAAAGYTSPLYEVNYRDYNIENAPANLDADDQARKKATLKKYAYYDSAVSTGLDNTGWSDYAWSWRMYYRWSRGTQWAGRNQDGRAQAFVVRNGAVYTYWQTPAGLWGGPLLLAAAGGPLAPGIAVGRNPDGRLEVFAHRLSDHHLLALPQTAPNGVFRSYWDDLGNPNTGYGNEDNVGTPVVAANADGRLEVFVKNGGGGVSTIFRTASGSWYSSWVDLGGADLQDGLAVVTNPGGMIELFGSTRQKILHWYQSAPNSGFVYDNDFPVATPASPPSAALNQRGSIDLLYRQPSTTRLMLIGQIAPVSAWNPTLGDVGGQGGVGEPAMVTAPPGSDARIMVFTRNKGTGVSSARQSAPDYGYGTWTDLLGVILDYPSAVTGMQDRVVVFTIGINGVYAGRQVAAGGDQPFGAWEALGM